ncbi:hypothetical protein M2T38_27465, partial [Klebsiella pneumoniae]|nr:hypothetical protein [Klebsiella pneumoniae]
LTHLDERLYEFCQWNADYRSQQNHLKITVQIESSDLSSAVTEYVHQIFYHFCGNTWDFVRNSKKFCFTLFSTDRFSPADLQWHAGYS